eukprot:TRINITY_DN12221_c0_g1_i1.p1 TRINITY_DN12221_c0_g1~~TRINITY_DN12221_c0_g1_i1.p1  ORF type:complete len:1031 (+),score=290.26 TRINITY_DN12221_c0_g1_i1:49-3141(+)
MAFERHQRAKEFIESLTNEPLPNDLFEALRDGTRLASLAEVLNPLQVKKPQTAKMQHNRNQTAMSFFYIGECVGRFSTACRNLGVDPSLLVTAQDLEDRGSFEKVVNCVLKVAQIHNPTAYPTIPAANARNPSPRPPTRASPTASPVIKSLEHHSSQTLAAPGSPVISTFNVSPQKTSNPSININQPVRNSSPLQQYESAPDTRNVEQEKREKSEAQLASEIQKREYLESLLNTERQRREKAESLLASEVQKKESATAQNSNADRQLREKVDALTAQLNNEHQLREKAESLLNSEQSKRQSFEAKFNNITQQRDKLDAQLKAESAKITKLEELLTAETSRREKAESQLASSKQQQVSNDTNQNKKDEENRRALEQKVQSLTAELTKLKQANATLEQQVQKLKTAPPPAESKKGKAPPAEPKKGKGQKNTSQTQIQQQPQQAKPAQPAQVERSVPVPAQTSSADTRQQKYVREQSEAKIRQAKEFIEKLAQKQAELNKKRSVLEAQKSSSSTEADQLADLQVQLDQLKAKYSALAEAKSRTLSLIRDESRLKQQVDSNIARARQPVQSSSSHSSTTNPGESAPRLKPGSYEVVPWEQLKIGKQIGTGAFAEVFEGFRAGERVAVKKFLAQSEEARREMEAEVSVMANLHSGFVVSLYGACFTAPNMCIVMEFLSRGSLFYLLNDSSVDLPWEIRWSIARDAALGICYLHSKRPQLLHRDMKSGNLLVGVDWRVKVCDFGQSEDAGAHDTKKETENPLEGPGGTARWTAPEVLSGKTYTAAADVYSYGIILWEIATRKIPFDDVPSYNLTALVLKGSRPPEPEGVPSEWLDLMKRCWSPDPLDRPPISDVEKFFARNERKCNLQKANGEDPISKLSNLQTELEQCKREKEELEKGWESFELKSEREKQQRNEYERQKEEVDKKIAEEKRRIFEVERVFENAERKVALERQGAAEQEKKKHKDSKKVAEKQKKVIESLETERDDALRKFETEKQKADKTKAQLEETLSLFESEKNRRSEVERQRDEAQRKARR